MRRQLSPNTRDRVNADILVFWSRQPDAVSILDVGQNFHLLVDGLSGDVGMGQAPPVPGTSASPGRPVTPPDERRFERACPKAALLAGGVGPRPARSALADTCAMGRIRSVLAHHRGGRHRIDAKMPGQLANRHRAA